MPFKNQFLSFLALCAFCSFTPTALAQDNAKPIVKSAGKFGTILFVGNSFSYFNNGLHNHLGNLVRANDQWKAGKNRFRLLTLSGGRFSEQLSILPSFLASNKSKWDLVVLQEYSTGPISKKGRKIFPELSKRLAHVVRKNGSKPVFFMTWPYENKPRMATPLARQYIKAANNADALAVPVGLAFARMKSAYPQTTLHSPDFLKIKDGKTVYRRDLKHPSLAGTYLAACVFYAALYGQSPEGNLYTAGLDADLAKNLQRIAWQTTSEFYAN